MKNSTSLLIWKYLKKNSIYIFALCHNKRILIWFRNIFGDFEQAEVNVQNDNQITPLVKMLVYRVRLATNAAKSFPPSRKKER